jgi:hypothetical protein
MANKPDYLINAPLVGKFIMLETDDEHYLTGKIVTCIMPTLYLFRPDDVPATFMRLIDLDILPETTVFFNSRAEMALWFKWLETPSESGKVIHLAKGQRSVDSST